ncbi:MAG: PAS domain S-box protein [Reichenbachiella sp.]|uniref:sensor histidine kinase n=1 Tax=Reichenbachiella sp. TaxID=2184521 RepID=UPI00326432EE
MYIHLYQFRRVAFMEIQSTVSTLLGMLILGSGIYSIYQGAWNRRIRQRIPSNKKLLQENKNLKFMLRQAQQEVKIGSWEWNTRTNEIYWSDEMYTIFELPPENGPDIDSLRLLILKEDRAMFDQSMRDHLNGRVQRRMEYRIRTQAGNMKYIAATGRAIFDKNKKPFSLFGTAQDITTQKEISKSLFQEKKKYHLLADSLPVAIFRSNVKGELLFVNQAMVDMFGFESEEELLQQNCFALYANPKDRENLLDELDDSGKLTDYQTFFQRRNGSTFIGEQNSLIEGNELHGIIQDISERVESEKEKSSLIEKLKGQNKDLEEFAFILSHNLRSPLANMMGLTKIFDKSTATSDNLEILNLIEQSTLNLDLIIKDLNRTLTVREGEKKLREVIIVDQTAQEVMSNFQSVINDNQICIEFDILPDAQIKSVPEFFKNILVYLIDNAIKFRSKDSQPKVKLSFAETQSSYILSVCDNGIGIDLDANESRLFMIYEKLDGKMEGRGLGLYLVKSHVNALNGNISVESQIGNGSKFIVELPKE